MFDITPFLKPDDPWPPAEGMAKVLDCYDFKYRLAQLLQPASILEFGVRAGYSAAAFLSACPTASYIGVDADNGQDGGIIGFTDWAAQMLPSKFPNARIAVYKANTQQPLFSLSLSLSLPAVDLFHVDADHSYAGCLCDLEHAEQIGTSGSCGRHHFSAGSRGAAEAFLAKRRYGHVLFPSFRGDLLIQTVWKKPR